MGKVKSLPLDKRLERCYNTEGDLLEMLYQAFLRPGRLEEHLEFPLPKFDDLCKLIEYYLDRRVYDLDSDKVMTGVPHDETCVVKDMAWLAAGSSQAGIEAAINKAKRLAAAEDADKITLAHWTQAILEARMGLKQPLTLTERDVKLLSWHEAGHGLAPLI